MKTSVKSALFLTARQRQSLQKALKQNLSAISQQRIQIMLLADQGATIEEISQQLGCAYFTAKYWHRITQQGLIEQWSTKPIGRPRKVDDRYIALLQELLHNPPQHYGYPFRRWTVDWLIKHLAQELGVEVSNRNLKRLLKALGLSTCGTSCTDRPTTTRVQIADISSTLGDSSQDKVRFYTRFHSGTALWAVDHLIIPPHQRYGFQFFFHHQHFS